MEKHTILKQQKYETRYRIYDFLVDFITQNGYAPSVREICEGVGLKSTSSVFNHLMNLEFEGKIEMKDHSPRAIKVIGYEFVKKRED